MSEKLKPCPFCGSKAYLQTSAFTGMKTVICDCASHVFFGAERSEVRTIAAWNARCELNDKARRIITV